MNSRNDQDSTTSRTTFRSSEESELRSARQLLSKEGSMNPRLAKELEELKQLVTRLDQFQEDVDNESLAIYTRQAAEAAVVVLKEAIAVKMRDIRRRMKHK